jgi:hypothetical protein
MLEERLKTKKDFEHFGNPFTTGVAGLIHVGEFDDCRRIKDSANGDKLAANMANTDMYKSWLMSSGETSMF